MTALDYILRLLKIPSPTGDTLRVTDEVMNILKELGYSPRRSRKGGVWCDLTQGEGEGILLSAHVDTLGGMVRSVKPNGRIRYIRVAGGKDATLETENCTVFSRNGKAYSATVQSCHASQHVFRGMGEEPRTDETLEVVLDEKVKTAEDVRKLGIDTGCFIAWDPRTQVTESGYVKSRFLDDKASAGILLKIAEDVARGTLKPARPLSIMFTVFEEVGHGAAMRLPENIGDLVAVDMGCVGDDLKCDETMVSICVKDSSGPYHLQLVNTLIDLAEKNHLQYAADVYPAYGSDAGAAIAAGNDVRFVCVGPGVFASHGYERTHVEGIDNTMKLLCAFVTR